jgi:hypothetical protein
MKQIALILLFGSLAMVAQAPAPKPVTQQTPVACTQQEIPDLAMAPRIKRSFGLLTMDSQNDTVLLRHPFNTVPLPEVVQVVVPCLTKKGSDLYVLTPEQARALVALK